MIRRYWLAVLGFQLRNFEQPWKSLPVFILFISLGISSASEVKSAMNDANLWHAILISFAGPSISGGSLTQALKWLVPHILFFYLVGGIANEELLNRGYAIMPLIGSRRIWWLTKLTSVLLLSVAYILLWFLGVFIGSALVLPMIWVNHPFFNSGDIWPFPDDIKITVVLLWIFGLYLSTLFALTMLQMTISVWWRRSFYAFTAIVFISILSWLLGIDQPALVRWLPGSQSILSRHTFLDPSIPGFTFEWSLLYNGFIFLLALGVSSYYIRHLDIFGNPVADIF